MVQLQDLRAGNYVFYNTIGSVPLTDYRFENPRELCRVTGLEPEKVVLQFLDEQIRNEFSPEVHTHLINISPVRLSPEIVDACRLEDNHFQLLPNGEDYRYKDQTVKYLHQLQNLYADATGQALEVVWAF